MKHRVVITVEGNKITDVVEVYGGDVARIPKCSVLPPQLPSDHIILFLPKDERMFIGIAKRADWWHRSKDGKDITGMVGRMTKKEAIDAGIDYNLHPWVLRKGEFKTKIWYKHVNEIHY